MFYEAMGYAQAKNVTSAEESKSATYAGKTISCNIYIGEIVITSSPDAQSGNSPISDDDYKMRALKLSYDAQENFTDWLKRQSLIIGISGFVAILAIFGFFKVIIEREIEKRVEKLVVDKEIPRFNKEVDKEISRLNKLLDNEMILLENKKNETIDATHKANKSIKKTKKALENLQSAENELENKQDEFQRKISEEIHNKEEEIATLDSKTKSIEDKQKTIEDEQQAFNKELQSKTENEMPQLEQKINALERVINILDNDGKAKERVVAELIKYLESNNSETKNEVAEFLPGFEPKSIDIYNTFLDILNNKSPDRTFRPILLSGLGKLRGDGDTLTYLLKLVENMNDPDILAIIGALGEIGEKGEVDQIRKISENKITDQNSESIIDKLLFILNDDLDNKELSKKSEITASDIRGDIALALSYYGKKAAKAVNDVIKILADEKTDTCIKACIALGKIGEQAAIPALQKLMDDEDTWEEVKKAASEAIEKIQQSA